MNFCAEKSDFDFNLDHLHPESQTKFLKKKILFQGRPTSLKSLIQDEILYKYITSEVLTTLLENGTVSIGNEIVGLSNLEGSYSDISMEMDFESFARRVKHSNDIFLVRSKQSDGAVEYFNNNFDENWIITKFVSNKIYDLKQKIDNGKVMLVNDRFQSEDFKNFCRNNSEKKCRLIDVKDLERNSFVLQELYNPHFYVKRKIKKIFIKADRMRPLVGENESEIFIISGEKNEIIANCSNVKWLSKNEAKNMFKQLEKSGLIVHWLEVYDEMFIWKNSYGSLKNLRKFVNHEVEEELPIRSRIGATVLEEDALIPQLADRNVVIIADNPGTGKTTTMIAMCKAEQITDGHWIIIIHLKDHLEGIRDHLTSKELKVKNVIQFLQMIDQSLKNELTSNLLKVALTSENKLSKRLLLAFDGFDELFDEDVRMKIMNLFKFLKNETHCKIWITSRLQHKHDLEYLLETFAIEFEPFDDETIKSIRKFFEKSFEFDFK